MECYAIKCRVVLWSFKIADSFSICRFIQISYFLLVVIPSRFVASVGNCAIVVHVLSPSFLSTFLRHCWSNYWSVTFCLMIFAREWLKWVAMPSSHGDLPCSMDNSVPTFPLHWQGQVLFLLQIFSTVVFYCGCSNCLVAVHRHPMDQPARLLYPCILLLKRLSEWATFPSSRSFPTQDRSADGLFNPEPPKSNAAVNFVRKAVVKSSTIAGSYDFLSLGTCYTQI